MRRFEKYRFQTAMSQSYNSLPMNELAKQISMGFSNNALQEVLTAVVLDTNQL